MPRIDPIQLLNCLSVLLSPSGGIKSRDEVQRLASLMTKFSKKLVSKCIYVQILKCTETDLLGLFMGSGGWLLVHMWLTESIVTKNWPLVHELLELLLLCPVDIERLKTNNCPKLVKELSKDGNHFAIRALASKLVEQWLKTVKGEQVVPVQIEELSKIVNDASKEIQSDVAVKEENIVMKVEVMAVNDNESKGPESSIEPTDANDSITEKDVADTKIDEDDKVPVLKISLKDGKQVLSQVEDNENKNSEGSDNEKEHNKSKSKEKSKERSSSNSSSNSKSSNTSSRHSTKRHSSSSSSDKNKSSHRSSSSSRHSSKEGSKDKHSTSRSKSDSKSSKSSDRSSSSSSRSKEERKSLSDKDKKEKGKDEKSKENLQKGLTEKVVDDKAPPTPPSIHKLGKIPKLSDVKRDKPSISIEVRKPDEPKPKTVKTFHSKFRKHGLEEEIKPPPSRAAVLNKKPPHIVPPPSVPIPKRPSPVHNETPPEKKIKIIEPVEKPGAIKLIPPKPKRPNWSLLLEYPSLNNSLGCVFEIGKSNKYMSSKVLHSLVKCLLQINAQFHMNLSVNIIDLDLWRTWIV